MRNAGQNRPWTAGRSPAAGAAPAPPARGLPDTQMRVHDPANFDFRIDDRCGDWTSSVPDVSQPVPQASAGLVTYLQHFLILLPPDADGDASHQGRAARCSLAGSREPFMLSSAGAVSD